MIHGLSSSMLAFPFWTAPSRWDCTPSCLLSGQIWRGLPSGSSPVVSARVELVKSQPGREASRFTRAGSALAGSHVGCVDRLCCRPAARSASADHLANHIVRTAFRFLVHSPDVFSDNPQEEQIHARQEGNRQYQSGETPVATEAKTLRRSRKQSTERTSIDAVRSGTMEKVKMPSNASLNNLRGLYFVRSA
jgi:hypothetical protein